MQTREQQRGIVDTPVPKNLWEQQYEIGYWDYLRTIGELGRFSVLVGYLHELKPNGAAIDKARAAGTGPFMYADAEQFVASDTYDAIVFNECLYYFIDPVGTVGRNVSALRPNVIIIVSTFLPSRRGRAILRALERKFAVLDETSVSHGAETWTCSVLAQSPIAMRATPG